MTFRHYVEQLYEFLEQHPEAEDYTAVYCNDEHYQVDFYPPVIGEYAPGYTGDFYTDENIKPNAVCIN